MPKGIDKTFVVLVFAFATSAFAASRTTDVSCAGTLLGERVCASLPALSSDQAAPKMAAGRELHGELAPPVGFVAEQFNSHDDNADYQIAESADGSLALGEALRADSEMRDVQNRLKGWQIPGAKSSLPTLTTSAKPNGSR